MTDTTPARSSRDQIVLTLYDLFRRRGFEGSSLSDISEATGLGKSSLYHHFPGGKDDMAQAVADFAASWISEKLLAPLAASQPIATRVDAMLRTTREMYEGGGAPCLVASLIMSPGLDLQSMSKVRAILKDWVDAIAKALNSSGIATGEAKRRARLAVIVIQGALILARATGDKTIFDDALANVKRDLLAPA